MLLTPGTVEKVLWQEMLRHELLAAATRGAVVIVPVGSIEQHGPHLPLDVDISVPYHLAVRAAVRCAELPVLVTPPVTFGVAHYKMGEPSSLMNDHKEQAKELFAKAFALDPTFTPDWGRPAPPPSKP